MQLHTLRPLHALKASRRVARGGKRGAFSGRGIKGQKSRAGAKIRPALRDVIKKIPKQRGRSKHQFRSRQVKPVTLNIGELGRLFVSGGEVTPQILFKAGAIKRAHGRIPGIKILGEGEVRVVFKIRGCAVSGSARSKIEAAGGSVIE
ncbi:uL15 family ribosomal protein [Candidatus Parcubacteria bacterium]|nr:uL15 family ribosomal protein [Candidatus Parcubacteria bacterium]MBI4098965.1 uL15 family ribosomal protein [Candidatus Parcubacteria bacterium]